MVYVYVLYNLEHNRRYIGQTTNLKQRLKQHNAGKTKSTKPYRPWIMVYSEDFETLSEALAREKYLKSGSGREYLNKVLAP